MLALALGGFGIGTTEFASMGLLPAMASATGVSEPVAGHFVSAYALGVVVGAPVIAALAARVERRTLLIALMGTFVIGNLATALAPGYETLLAARFLAGLPHGAYFGVAALVAAHLAEPGKRAKAVATVMMGLSVANVIGVPATAFFGQILGWRSAFEARKDFHRAVDIVPCRRSWFEDKRDVIGSLAHMAAEDGIVVYERR